MAVPPADARLFTRPSAALLALLVAAGAALRLHALGRESAWLDEAFSFTLARGGLEEVFYEARLDVHPPLYYVLLTGWFTLVDPSIRAARLLSVACSLATLVAAYAAALRLTTRATALLATALLAVSVFQVEFAQEARMYALLTLLATLSMLGFMRLFDRVPRPGGFLLYTVATALMAYTQVYGLFVLAAQGLAVAANLAWRRTAALPATFAWLAAMSLVFAAFLAWLPEFTWQVALVRTRFWIAEPEPTGFIAAFRSYAGSTTLLQILAPLAVVGAVALAWRPSAVLARPPLFFLLPWLLGPIVFPFVLSLVGTPIFLPKYTIPASVPFAILAASGVMALPARPLRGLAAAVVLVLALEPLPAYYATPTKDGWREAASVVEAQARADDAVVLYPYFNAIAFEVYRQRAELQVRPLAAYGPPPPADGWPVTLERATAGRNRVWLVTLRADRSSAPVVEALGRTHVLRQHQVRQKIEIFRFDRRSGDVSPDARVFSPR